MNLRNSSSSPFHRLVASAVLLAGFAAPAQAIDVVYSGTAQADDQVLLNLITTNFKDVNLTYGDFSDYPTNSATIEGADVFIIGRRLSSAAYAVQANSDSFNALTIPVVSLTSYVTRPLDGRWGWHDGDVNGGLSVAGDETTVTAAGASVFGVPTGTYDWLAEPGNYNAFGTGGVGDGEILATVGGAILAAHWDAGDLTGSGATLGGERFLWNAHETGGTTSLPTAAGQTALLRALAAYTPLELAVEGDVNDDGSVDLTDYQIIRDNFRLSPATKAEGNLVGPGNVVDLNDFLFWRSHYTGSAPIPSSLGVPEPAALLLVVLGLTGAACRRNRA